ncbi:SMC-Scp complex subunit ScpB [Dactylosporangium sp. AC04546]|uniref:SMC-Scp complex subunit ScpB n=1 Tax=Dactylosporangium sp. AC04546 TaxID=2862460 RepID=UPI003FA42CE6
MGVLVDSEETDIGAVDSPDGEAAPAGEQPENDALFAIDAPAAGAAPAERVAMSDAELRGAVEAILLIVDEPTSEVTLAQVLEQPVDRVRVVLEDVSRGYTSMGLGFDLRRVAGGWRLYTRPEYAAYVEKFVLDGQQVRLTQAALETLAVVAYKQPVTRSRISAIRGVNCDGVVRTLVTRGLIEEVGSEPESGALLYRTTTLFLEKLGLDSVDQLPPLAPFLPDDIDEIADAQR